MSTILQCNGRQMSDSPHERIGGEAALVTLFYSMKLYIDPLVLRGLRSKPCN